jgi:2-C-methyl-D-erythritol 4-phosphate cytidylyltransferase
MNKDIYVTLYECFIRFLNLITYDKILFLEVITMNTAVILAAGKGSRMKTEINKQFLMLDNEPVISYTIRAFNQCCEIDEIIIVASLEEQEYFRNNILKKYNFTKVKSVVPGGNERQQSAYNGIKSASIDSEIILIHDGARPFVSQQTIKDCISAAKLHGAASAGMPSKDTIKLVDEQNIVIKTLPRDKVWLTQTPQAFQKDLIHKAHEAARDGAIIATDDAMLIELLGHKVIMVEAAYENIKITTPEDLPIAMQLIKIINK